MYKYLLITTSAFLFFFAVSSAYADHNCIVTTTNGNKTDTCNEGEICIDTKACRGNELNSVCGSGHCVPESEVPTPEPPEEGDSCRRAITDPGGGGCGSNMHCKLTGNCSGTHLNQTCDGVCEPKPDKGDTCQSSPGLHNQQGNCPDGLICKGGAACNSTFCEGTCEEPEEEEKKLPPPPPPPCAQGFDTKTGACPAFLTAFGEIATNPTDFIRSIFALLLAIAGGIALLLIIKAGYQFMVSAGNPEMVKAAREQLIAAIVGLLFIIFSFVILEVVGVDILRLPCFSSECTTTVNQNPPGHGGTCDVNNDQCSVPGESCVPNSPGSNIGHCQPSGPQPGNGCSTNADCVAGEVCSPDLFPPAGKIGFCKSTTPGTASCDLNNDTCPTPLVCVSNGGGRGGTCQNGYPGSDPSAGLDHCESCNTAANCRALGRNSTGVLDCPVGTVCCE